jgi:hypothetical protein
VLSKNLDAPSHATRKQLHPFAAAMLEGELVDLDGQTPVQISIKARHDLSTMALSRRAITGPEQTFRHRQRYRIDTNR